MKNLKMFLIMCLVSIAFISCTNKHEKLIDGYMKEHLHNYSSYEPISFEVDSIMEVADTVFRFKREQAFIELENFQYGSKAEKVLKEIDKSLSDYENSNRLIDKNIPKNIDELCYFLDKTSTNRSKLINRHNILYSELDELRYVSERLINRLDSLNKVSRFMDKVLDRWVITHRYRVDNGYGSLSLRTTKFIINKDKTEIIDSYRIED